MLVRPPNCESMFVTPGMAAAGSTSDEPGDPYEYQHGFGNHHVSEAVSGALPRGRH